MTRNYFPGSTRKIIPVSLSQRNISQLGKQSIEQELTAASNASSHDVAKFTFPYCPGHRAYLYFADPTVTDITRKKGTLMIRKNKQGDSEPPFTVADLGVQAQCAVGQKEGQSDWSRSCD